MDVPEAERRRFSITDAEVEELARYAMIIEKHYGRPMDIEWGKDGVDGKLYVLQARPETVKAGDKVDIAAALPPEAALRGAGDRPGDRQTHRQRPGAWSSGRRRRCRACATGDVLVTDMTDPDWEPVMKRAAAIVTNRGGRTCHAAIIARELGIPAVVGCGDAHRKVREGRSR